VWFGLGFTGHLTGRDGLTPFRWTPTRFRNGFYGTGIFAGVAKCLSNSGNRAAECFLDNAATLPHIIINLFTRNNSIWVLSDVKQHLHIERFKFLVDAITRDTTTTRIDSLAIDRNDIVRIRR
jgi:hypothetical protein